jgi:hypothetical protein
MLSSRTKSYCKQRVVDTSDFVWSLAFVRGVCMDGVYEWHVIILAITRVTVHRRLEETTGDRAVP